MSLTAFLWKAAIFIPIAIVCKSAVTSATRGPTLYHALIAPDLDSVSNTTFGTVFSTLNRPDVSVTSPSNSSISTASTTEQYIQQNESLVTSSQRSSIDTLSHGTTDVAPTYSSSFCDEDWVQFGQHCYLIKGTRVNWEIASSRCNLLDGHLASVLSQEENDFLYGLMNGITSFAWIGLHDFDQDGNFVWDGGSALDNSNWTQEIRQLANGAEQCVLARRTWHSAMEWVAVPCRRLVNYICKKNAILLPNESANDSSLCRKGWIQYGQYCYTLDVKQVQGYAAAEHCSDANSEIASIHSSEQNEFLTEMMFNKSVTSSWIGLRYHYWGRIYQWLDGSDVDFVDCRSWQPYAQCSLTHTCFELIFDTRRADFKRGWKDSDCDQFRSVICQKPIAITKNVTEDKDGELDESTSLETPASKNISSFCEEGWLQYDQYCYIVKRNAMSWMDASTLCYHIGGHLASIHSKEQNDFLGNMLVEKLVRRCWIGGFNIIEIPDGNNVSIRRFRWHDGSKVDYAEWVSHINENATNYCIFMVLSDDIKGGWAMYRCENNNPFICQKKGKQKTKTTENETSRNDDTTIPATEVTTEMKNVSTVPITEATTERIYVSPVPVFTVPVIETTTEWKYASSMPASETIINKNGDNTGSVSVSTVAISAVLAILFCALVGGMMWYKRPWLVDKRAKLATVLFRSYASNTKYANKWTTEILINDEDQEKGTDFNYKHLNERPFR